MKKPLINCLLLLSVGILLQTTIFAQPVKESDALKRIRNLIEEREKKLNRLYGNSANVRAATYKFAMLTLLTEEAINKAAQDANITATDNEVATFLFPLLAQQGLIDVTNYVDVREDKNVKRWLEGQDLKVDDLIKTGRTLLQWTKLAIADVSIDENEVKEFVKNNPQIRFIPERIQLSIRALQRPDGQKSIARGVDSAMYILPSVQSQTRSANQEILKQVGGEWEDIQLYLGLDQLDPVLRKALENKKVDDKFGPVILQNKAVVAGKIAKLLPKVDFADSPDFWKFAAIQARLAKAKQSEKFTDLIDKYLSPTGTTDPQVRDIFGDVGNFVKNNVVTIATVGGAAIGAYAGGPAGAMQGAQYGFAAGTVLDGLINNRPINPSVFTQMPMGGGVNPMYTLPQQPSPPPTQQMQPYYQGPPQSIPQAYAPGAYMQSPPQFVPAMPPAYQPYPMFYYQPIVVWYPPVYMPMPVRYGY